jgi:alpha-glucuronidase
MKYRIILAVLFVSCYTFSLFAEDGHSLWLRYPKGTQTNITCNKQTATTAIAKQELIDNWNGAPVSLVIIANKQTKSLGKDGFSITGKNNVFQIQALSDNGLLYGVYHLLRMKQTGELDANNNSLSVEEKPSYQVRALDHWDNLDGTVERGYAGYSIFWRHNEQHPTVTDADKSLWKEYARANASIGINGAVLNNVNASPKVLSNEYLQKVKAIAGVLRPYGIKTYLSVNFSSPARLGGLKTSDPLDPEVIKWWKVKVSDIYTLIPDFGGFLVKANSEGQPGPQDFGRTHADGANMMADALKPYGGIVMWRAFVYSSTDKDRARQAYSEFLPLDGQFRDNVIIQIKNGPIDFQPREPFSPLFGAMGKTSVMPELQITQEYLGHSVQLVFLSPMWEEFLKSDTYQKGAGSTIARCTDGSVNLQKHTAFAGVANIGLDTNWCGHHFAQANWYAFGRLAWNNRLTSDKIAEEWIKLTFSPRVAQTKTLNNSDWRSHFLVPVKQMMLQSHEAAVDYMMPLGLHHIFAANHHYGPGPWYSPKDVRPDWTPVYYHKADTMGIGFDRTRGGSDAVSQYHEPLCSQFDNTETCPEIYLLWFHHLPWNYKMKNGRILWDELCYHYDKGVQEVRQFQKTWDQFQTYIDEQRFSEVQSKLRRQCRDAQVWKDACLLYFQQFSRQPISFDIERPVYDLEYLEKTDPLLIQK